MNQSLQARLRAAPAAAGRLAAELFREMAPKVLFFFCAFILIFLLLKLFVAQYAIEFAAFSKAALAALILGKTLVYAFAVIVLGVGERIFSAARAAGGLAAGGAQLLANANFDRFLGLTLLITLVVAVYLTIQEINRALGGEGALSRLLFQLPTAAKGKSHVRPATAKLRS